MTLEEFLKEWNDDSDKVLVHTSGSTGTPKPLWAEKQKMRNSARITCDFLGLQRGDTALLCMPLDYIAGKMMVVRAVERDLKLTAIEPCGNPFGKLLATKDELSKGRTMQPDMETADNNLPKGGFDLVAMVPMQVYNTMQRAEEKNMLMKTRHLIIGGGVVDEALERSLQDFPNAVWSTYGMTETLSHIALRRINGAEASAFYVPFESVSVSVNGEGCLMIDAPLVCSGRLVTNDIAEMASDGRRFRLLGRKDNVICSGGIKIQAEDVERMLKPHMHAPYIISKRKDRKFGEIVVLIVQSADTALARDICKRVLPPYYRPRLYVPVASVPLTETGKPARAEAARIAAEYCCE